MTSDRLDVFRKAYNNLDLTPLLDPNELKRFWVEYGTEALEELQQLVEDDDTQSGKTIFAGHRGCGKSTLLAEFGRRCQGHNYFVAYFSIADAIEMSDVDHIQILFAIALNLMLEAEAEQVKIPAATKKQLDQWFATRTRVETETPANAQVSVGFNLFEMVKGRFQTEASVRNEIRREFERNISDLVARLNEIAAAIQGVTHRKILVIVDGLDKLDLSIVKEIFHDHIKSLFLPGFQIIFTIPIATLRDRALQTLIVTESNDQIVVMGVTKLFAKGDRRNTEIPPNPETEATLCEILQKRFTDVSANLLEPEVAKQIVRHSGGVLRELIRLTNICCRICLRQIRRVADPEEIVINESVLAEAIQEMRLDFELPLGKDKYAILQATYEHFAPDDPKDQKFLDLLRGLHILEYRNAEVWYDVHPIVEDLLRRKGLLQE